MNKKVWCKANETEDGIYIKYRDEKGIHYKNIEFTNYFFIKMDSFVKYKKIISRFSNNATEYGAINGEFVKIYLNDNTQRNFIKRILEKKGVKTYEADIMATKRFLIDKYDNFSFGDLKILWYDLETDDRGDFLKDETGTVITGEKQILSISMLDEEDKGYYFFNKNPDDKTLQSEFDLFKQFFNVMKDYDLVTAWNGINFDRPYIEQRLNYLRKAGHDVSDFEEIWRMLVHLDELVKFKNLEWGKYDSYSLENIANDVLGDGKIDFSDDVPKGKGKFYALFKSDPAKFEEYNRKDVILMKQIDEKKGHFKIAKHLSSYTKTPIESFMYNSHILDYIMLRKNHDNNRICNSKPTYEEKDVNDKINVSGGFTYCFKTGKYNYIPVFDFKSMYPTIGMGTFNISDDVYISNMYPDIDEVRENFDEKEFELLTMILRISMYGDINEKDIDKYIKQNKLDFNEIMFKFIDKYVGLKAKEYAYSKDYIWTPADLNKDTIGYRFHPHRFFLKQRGVLSEIAVNAVQERDKIKYKVWKMKKDNPDSIETEEYKKLDQEQLVLKTLANSAYGFSGLKISRFFEWNVSDTITSVSRWTTKKSILFAKTKGYESTNGDSVVKDTKIIVDGETLKIEDLWNKYKPDMYYRNDGKEEINLSEHNILTPALKIKKVFANKHSTKKTDKTYVVKRNIKRIIRHKIGKKLYKIKTETGKELIVTEDHSCIVNRDKKIVQPLTKDIKVGDYIYVNTKLGSHDLFTSWNKGKKPKDWMKKDKYDNWVKNKTQFKEIGCYHGMSSNEKIINNILEPLGFEFEPFTIKKNKINGELGRLLPDFVNEKKKLVIEVNGSGHKFTNNDKIKEKWLTEKGYKVYHLNVNEKKSRLTNLKLVLENKINNILKENDMC